MALERSQFRLLHRDFLSRMVDLELLASDGDIQKLLGQLAALVSAFSFVLAVLMVPRYAGSRLSAQQLAVAAWGDEEFLISTAMAMAGTFAVIAWNAVLPDRQDSLILGPLPVRARTIFGAKAAAMLTALGVCVAAVNAFTGIALPLFVGGARTLAVYWLTMLAASVFVFGALLAVQGIAAQIFSYGWFLRVSGGLQLLAFFVVLSFYFLTPPLATPRRLAAPENQQLLGWLPSFWFLGLFQELQGHAHPVFSWLAARAVRSLLFVIITAGATYALTYLRQFRRIVEQPDIAPVDRSRPAARFASAAVAQFFQNPLDCAIVLFVARTISRSRQHRFLLAAYGGVGLAIAFAYAKDFLYGADRSRWHQPTLSGLAIGFVLLAFTVIGVRGIFVLPLTLRANWVFRLTAVHSPSLYFSGVRKSLLVFAAAPVCAVSAFVYPAIWPRGFAVEHVSVLVATGFLLVDLSLYQFRKVPFTCSYLPGKANLKVKLGVYAGILFAILSAGSALEFVAMQTPAKFSVFLTILIGIASWAWLRSAEFAASPGNLLQFEEAPPAEVVTLGLSGDRDTTYLDSTSPLPVP